MTRRSLHRSGTGRSIRTLRGPWRALAAAVLGSAVLATWSCAGRAVPEASHDLEVTAMPTPALFTLRSSAFSEGGPIPRAYTCDGGDVSPPLEWSGAPASTTSYALLVTDPDARGFVHWVAVDVPASVHGLAERASGTPAAGTEGRNDFGRTGWGGPCPPSGTHRYVFELYALSSPLNLPGRPAAADVRRAVAGRVIGEARLTGTYRRA